MDYIERIKKLKSERKITNDRLSELTGIPLGTLSKLLAGISDSPKLSSIVAIADALECSLDYLVKGIEENNNNYTLDHYEIELIEAYRELDTYGKELVSLVASKEAFRCNSVQLRSEPSTDKLDDIGNGKNTVSHSARILPSPSSTKLAGGMTARRQLLLYNLPVSAGPGVYLDDTTAEEIIIPNNEKTANANFALRISGNSMEPKYHDGDIVLVEETNSVELGELGVFILDGNGYFKKFGGDRLISLNPEYADIILRDYAENVCCGRVVGKLRKK